MENTGQVIFIPSGPEVPYKDIPLRFRTRLQHRTQNEDVDETKPNYTVPWDTLPDEVLINIFSYLPVWDLCQIENTCKIFYNLAKDQYVGLGLDFSKFKGKLSDRALTSMLTRSTNLKRLNLSGCAQLTVVSLSTIGDLCPGLESLSLCGMKLPEKNYIDIFSGYYKLRLTDLKYLDLSYCASICDSTFELLMSYTGNNYKSNLQTLKLNHCTRISDTTCEVLASFCPNLTHIELAGCFRISVGGLRNLLFMDNPTNSSQIKYLVAPPSLGIAVLRVEAEENAQKLVVQPARKVYGYQKVQKLGVKTFSSKKCESLEVLKFSSGHVVTDRCLADVLPRRFPNLTTVDLTNITATHISETGLRFMIERLKKMKFLVLKSSVPKQVIKNLQLLYPNLCIQS